MTLEDIGPDNWRHCAALEAEMALLVYPVVVSQKVASEGRRSLFSTRGRSTWRCVAKQDPEDIDAFQVKSTLLGDLRSRGDLQNAAPHGDGREIHGKDGLADQISRVTSGYHAR